MTTNHDSPGTDPDFLRRLQAGDEDAWSNLLDEWQDPLYRYLCYAMGNTEYATEVLSETLAALVKAIQNFDGRVAISTFIYRIAANKKADFWRRRRPVEPLPVNLTVAGPTSLGMELEEALMKLPESYREALLLRYHIGLSVSEVAESMGKTYKATESLLSRSRRQLRQILEGVSV
ncbi:MAG: RNA polymerase sigma factor [Caldilineaceae bacterium]|nr:RNA polymerase sigma factor [Caldilineaceae bacterium]